MHHLGHETNHRWQRCLHCFAWESLDLLDGALSRAPLSSTAFERWLNVCPDLTVDGARPTIEELMRRVAAFWLRDEVIVYVGLAKSLSKRLRQYYRTPVGACRPHAGGYFLKLLSNSRQSLGSLRPKL